MVLKTLDKLETGKNAKITKVGGTGALRRHLLDMGLTPHTNIKVKNVAPMGDPIVIGLRGYSLTIRKEDASQIEIKEVTNDE